MTDTERRLAATLCAQRDVYDSHHEAQDVPCGPCWRIAAALLPVVAEIEAEARAGALRDARDDLYAGSGPDFAADSDIVYGEWLGNRADSIARATEAGSDA